MTEQLVEDLVAGQADDWDLAGAVPEKVLRELGAAGLLCPEVPAGYGGRGATSRWAGEFTAALGAHCGSTRSVLTSQSMAAGMITRLGDRAQRAEHLPRLCAGTLAAVAFSEPGAGSDLSAITTEVRRDGDHVVVTGHKTWTTAARYADLVVVVGVEDDGGAAVVVPADAPGVSIRPVENPSGCRAAGHADVHLDHVRLPATAVLGGGGQPSRLLVTAALGYGRLSVAWGCVGILRACLAAASAHAASRGQFGVPLAEHQLVARHLAELLVAERTATLACEHASERLDAGSPDHVVAAVLAKNVAATAATRGASSAVQVLGSAAARDGHVVARAYRDAKLMEIIEGSTEICQLLLARHALSGGGTG
ncbi:acyl-CoA dehydrogenase family protein [Actinophytocola oryzae]|uniref:Methoxymalonate biosynthesis protein n=1 Tax=Actinophytocola oryzae TaxID=502181 RepID=A0A4R7VFF0_9PSEU|nr:acyl-CoA dehydrogenase family protein [Actinophytocola oryzae]TDV47970.1 methoxymalonate biosynthesis protein [Actinophytocola oryzae]